MPVLFDRESVTFLKPPGTLVATDANHLLTRLLKEKRWVGVLSQRESEAYRASEFRNGTIFITFNEEHQTLTIQNYILSFSPVLYSSRVTLKILRTINKSCFYCCVTGFNDSFVTHDKGPHTNSSFYVSIHNKFLIIDPFLGNTIYEAL